MVGIAMFPAAVVLLCLGDRLWGSVAIVESFILVAVALIWSFVFTTTTEPVMSLDYETSTRMLLLGLGTAITATFFLEGGVVGGMISAALNGISAIALIGSIAVFYTLRSATVDGEIRPPLNGEYGGCYAGKYGWLVGAVLVVLFLGVVIAAAEFVSFILRTGGWHTS
ncbi:MAG TPA: hypothetical protein VGX23_15825 [Actinocrinis sp.]|nr:hypothetical protein [Actinocrinis sp.]